MGATADARLTEREKIELAKASGYADVPCDACEEYALIPDGTNLTCQNCGESQPGQ